MMEMTVEEAISHLNYSLAVGYEEDTKPHTLQELDAIAYLVLSKEMLRLRGIICKAGVMMREAGVNSGRYTDEVLAESTKYDRYGKIKGGG